MAHETVICTYRVRAGEEGTFQDLLRRHWATLRRLGLVTEQEALVFRGLEEGLTYVEIFTWAEGGFGRAHEHPDVLEVWEAMDRLLEEREGRARWEFPHFEQLSLG